MFCSMIVPVYNVEPYLRKCLDSILACNIKDSEILLVTGISTDASNQICEEYQQRYSNIRMLSQNGRGLSNARNCGLREAQGEYILFLDSDDFVRPELLSEMLDQVRSHPRLEVFISDFVRLIEPQGKLQNIIQIYPQKGLITDREYLPIFLSQGHCFWNVWRYIYRRDFLEKNQLFFQENRMSEDVDYTVRVLLCAQKLGFCHTPYYCYRVGRGDSLMDTVTYRRVCDTVTLISQSLERIQTNPPTQAGELMKKRLLFELILNLATVCEVERKNRKAAKELFVKALPQLHHSGYPLGEAVYVAKRLMGITLLSRQLYLLKKGKRLLRRL